jgi:alpha-tubulin suppressor-like RCC1 family protein
VMCWGTNSTGQLGDGTTTTPRLLPVQAIGITGATALAAGQDHTCAIASGALFCWGSATNGQLGEGTSGAGTMQTSPKQVTGLTSNVTAVSAGFGFTCAVVNGGAKCWGDRSTARLGDGGATTGAQASPVDVSGLLAGSGVTDIATGFQHACAVVSGGVKCWGGNGAGQIGNNTATGPVLTPTDVFGLGAGSNVTQVVAGTFHTCALISGGTVKCWGQSIVGQVGTGASGSGIQFTTPQDVAITNVSRLSAGGNFTCALLTDGTEKCWGGNGTGAIGDGTSTSPRTTPTNVIMP